MKRVLAILTALFIFSSALAFAGGGQNQNTHRGELTSPGDHTGDPEPNLEQSQHTGDPEPNQEKNQANNDGEKP